MFHSIVRTIRRCYLGVVVGGYLLAFVCAFTMMFMLPIGSLGLVILGLMALVPVVFLWGILGAIERRLARRKLRAGHCPACGKPAIRARVHGDESAFECGSCRELFSSAGADLDRPDDLSEDEVRSTDCGN